MQPIAPGMPGERFPLTQWQFMAPAHYAMPNVPAKSK
jgi:hypothetical protein